jgi:hypothetical protein
MWRSASIVRLKSGFQIICHPDMILFGVVNALEKIDVLHRPHRPIVFALWATPATFAASR